MNLYLSGHPYHFECENLCRVFFPYSPVKRTEKKMPVHEDGEPYAEAVIERNENGYNYTVLVSHGKKTAQRGNVYREMDEYLLTRMVFVLFSEFTGYKPDWGMLTGIHPVKLLREYCGKSGEEEAFRVFCERFFVSEKKLRLAKEILSVQLPVIRGIHENDFSLYIGIPFCPTRCAYCSFISQDLSHAKKYVEPYFTLLLKEIEHTAEVAKRLELRLISVYIGGGTPTTLTAEQLEQLCQKVRDVFDMRACPEFTVEAGRPDTITAEKLAALKQNGVTRISINPQSLSDDVLKKIGRAHSAKDIETAFSLARKAGFRSINADLIVGLPGDDFERFQNTVRETIKMGASNITVHALAIKRAARLAQEGEDLSSHQDRPLAARMMDYSVEALHENGFLPYYLYRQTRMAGNLENTGWAKKNDICRYNVYTMDESSTVLACGAGGVSKLKDPYSNRLERIFNFKYPYEYIGRHDEILKRKEGVIDFYEQFRKRLH